MTRSLKVATVAILLSFAGVVATTVQARPPTVSNSPGYDARLAESRKAQAQYLRAAPMDAPKSLSKPVKRKRAPRG